MSTTDELLANAERHAATFDKGDLPLPPAKQVAIVACMDARLNPYGVLGLSEGDADVIRDAGGVIASPFIPHTDRVRGFVHDVAAGRLTEVLT